MAWTKQNDTLWKNGDWCAGWNNGVLSFGAYKPCGINLYKIRCPLELVEQRLALLGPTPATWHFTEQELIPRK